MTDFAVSFTATGLDILVDETIPGVVTDEGLVPKIIASLLCDARAELDETQPFAVQDLRGWWAEERGDRWGSRIWTLERAKQTQETLERARAYVREALAWMERDGIARAIAVSASYPARGRLFVEARIERGTAPRWSHLWRATEDVRLVAGDVELGLVFTQ